MKRKPKAPTIESGIVFCSIDASAWAGDEHGQRVHLIPVDADGNIVGVDGRHWKLNAENIMASARSTKTDIPVDYHHASLSAQKTGAMAPAAGWIKPASIEANSDGIFGIVEWTDIALNQLKHREFRYVSPVFTHTSGNETVALKGLALTHYPNLGDLEPVANSKQEENKMDEIIEEIREALNLPSASNAAEIKVELDKLFSRVGVLAANSDASLVDQIGLIDTRIHAAETLATAENSQFDPAAFVPRAEFDRVDGELKTVMNTQENARVETAVNAALTAGKITPASLAWAKDLCRTNPESFASFVANTQQVIPMGEDSHNAAGGKSALTDEEVAVCSQLGLSPEDFLKAKNEEDK